MYIHVCRANKERIAYTESVFRSSTYCDFLVTPYIRIIPLAGFEEGSEYKCRSKIARSCSFEVSVYLVTYFSYCKTNISNLGNLEILYYLYNARRNGITNRL